MKSTLFFALALALPSTAAMATGVAEKANSKLIEPTARKAGGCTGCACCDFILIGGLKIPVGFAVTGASPRPE